MSDHQPIHLFVTPQKSGCIRLPVILWDRLGLELPGARIEFLETESGTIEIQGVVPVPFTKVRYWQDRASTMEDDL